MAFEWQDLLETGRDLLAQAATAPNPERFYRSALSRFYFAAFGHAREYAVSFLGFVPHEASEDHGRLRAHLKNKRRAGDADRLERLRRLRNEADYAKTLKFSPNLPTTAANALEWAQRVFDSLTPPKTTS